MCMLLRAYVRFNRFPKTFYSFLESIQKAVAAPEGGYIKERDFDLEQDLTLDIY